MANSLQYIVDTKGAKQSVLVPISKWNEINEKYALLLNKVKVMTEIKNGFKEIKADNKTGKKLQTLNAFLNESNR